jgi:hypothetical protein
MNCEVGLVNAGPCKLVGWIGFSVYELALTELGAYCRSHSLWEGER